MVVLASGSPRRKQILTMLGVPFTVSVGTVDERAIEYQRPRELAVKAAFAKAGEIGAACAPGTLVVGADTIVVLDDTVFGKPESEEQAREFLRRLQGRPHTVITGVAVQEAGRSTLIDAVESRVFIQALSSSEIAEYVATGEPMDKAGAYAAQGLGRKLIQRIDGDFFNVVGLPAARLLDMLGGFMDVSSYKLALKRLTPEVFDSYQETEH
jgi:septum formation protein